MLTLEQAKKFQWSSITGNFHSERIANLESCIVGKKILDAGCGGGAYVDLLARKGLEVTGVDNQADLVSFARQHNQHGCYIQADLTSLPFPNCYFDFTYCFDVLEHIDDILAIKELARVTKERLLIVVPKKDTFMEKFNLTFLHYRDTTHLRYYDEDSLKVLASNIKSSKVRVFPELPVPIKELVDELVEIEPENLTSFEFKLLINFRVMKYVIEEIVKSKNVNFRNIYDKAYISLKNKIISEAIFKEIPTGLVAVIDFQ